MDVPHHAVSSGHTQSDQGAEKRRLGVSGGENMCHPSLVETDDSVEVNGHVFHKPFVEKPVSAEDHNIYIYFPSDYGGGCQRLFRKVSVKGVNTQIHVG